MHHALEPWRSGLDKLRNGRRLIVQNGGQRLRRRGPMECPCAGQHFIEDGSEGEDVGAMIDGLATHLLGGHVTGIPITSPGSVLRVSVDALLSGSGWVCINFASPKSRILTRPSLVTKRFSGLRSR